MNTASNKSELRPATVTLLARIIAPLVDTGLITGSEYDIITKELRTIARNGKPAIPTALISIQETAGILGISQNQIRQLVRESKLPFPKHRVGTNIKFLKKDVLEYAEFGSIESTATNNPSNNGEKP